MRIPPSFRKLSSKGQFTTPPFSLKNFSIALLVNAGLVHMSLYGSVPLTTFEPPISSGSNLSSVSSDWTVANGEAKVLSGVGYQGTQGVQLTKASNDEAHISRAISWNTSEQTAFIDLRIKPAANHQGSNAAIVVNGTQIGIQKNSADDSKGDIWVLNGKDSKWTPTHPYSDEGLNSPQWFLTYGEFPLNSAKTTASDYMRITLRQDYERKVWDLYIDGKLTAADLRFEQRGILDALHIYGSTVDNVMLDELQTLPSNMLFTDSDKDGIPDSVELANGSNPNLKDRDLIDPVTGKTYLQKYLEQLWPNNTPVGTGTYVASPGTIPPLTLPVHTPVGALKGNFSVGGDGSATYSIPIDLPKGTSGMEPQLSLNYSSNGGNGICGLGFGLSGLQSITRGPSSLKKDGFIDGVNFDVKDRFFLNGERLVCVAGTYGANGSEYRTEIDSYARITLSGNANSGHASYWTVQTKAGLTLQFGNTIDSRVSCSAATAPYAWSVNQVTDVSGNYYKLIYGVGSMSPYPSNAPIYAGSTIPDHRIAKIVYTGNEAASLTPYCSVDFIYENRTDTSFSYNYGIKFESTKRLKEIEVKTNSYQNHKYNLTYATSRQTGRSLLASVQKFVGTQAIPKTTINWDAFTSNDTVPLASDYTDPLAASSMWIKKSNSGTNTPQFYDYEGSQNNQDGIISFVSLEENDTVLHLTGNAWRAKAISYSVTPAMYSQ